MIKKLIGSLLLIVLTTQVFPVDGIQFWTKLIQGKAQISTTDLIALEEEEVEEIQFKLKNIESNHSLYFESQARILSDQAAHSIIATMGKAVDRNDPILIPPPNPSV
ncbi:MAG: hypothetical protein KA534_05390 [Sediminibacterium sp.]|nr:hypothetical protein [Sediminibacterium sp.]MBP6144242.1 hypothetical protein [Sediminibacterium sp.]